MRSLIVLVSWLVLLSIARVASHGDASTGLLCIDDNEECADQEQECDNSAEFLRVCRKTCLVCSDETLHQNAGLGRLPEEISLGVLTAMRQTNLYYAELKRNQSKYALVLPCADQTDMCAFWSMQGHCTEQDYEDYMTKQCRLSCRLCHSDLARATAFLHFLTGDLSQAYYQDRNSEQDERNVVTSRRQSLAFLLRILGMDPAYIGGNEPIQENWLLTLHDRLHALIPDALLRLYESPSSTVSDDDYRLLASLHGVVGKQLQEKEAVLASILVPYRSRGYSVAVLQDLDHLITRPIQLTVGFAVPNQEAMSVLGRIGPILQMGAGTGYWTALLELQSPPIDIVAYDIAPPGQELEEENAFFDIAYTQNIRQGSCVDTLRQIPMLARERTLLMIWPNDPDPIDNPQFCQGGDCHGSQGVWDADCLEMYVQNGGKRVVYVGERESNLRGNSRDSGISSTRGFQMVLSKSFKLIETIPLPNWWLNEDDLTVWEALSSNDEL